ncbi:MAG: hypothetical protein ACTSRS_05695 [Candidatus Helarchaeota archaeon]
MEFRPIDRDFLRTQENFYFCIIGYCHPSDRILAYLKYIPSNTGKWKSGKQRLHRVLPFYSAQAVLDTFQFLKTHYLKYLFFDKYSETLFSAVPIADIKEYFSANQRLQNIFSLQKIDPLQKKLKSFIMKLSELSNISITDFGVTGSILLNIHNPKFSDLDVTIYGTRNALKIKRLLRTLFEEGHSELKPLNKAEAHRWQKDKSIRFGIKLGEARELFKRKWNMGVFQKTRFSVHPIKKIEEIEEKYGEKYFKKKGPIIIRARVIASQSLFMPSTYQISDVEVIKGQSISDIKEVTSFEGLFDSVVETGEYLRAAGQLEYVKDLNSGIEYHRVVIGSSQQSNNEYIVKTEER